jgi:uncharacterized protein with HEPN domain
MPKEPKEYLRHIIDECSFLLAVSNKLEFDSFLENETSITNFDTQRND